MRSGLIFPESDAFSEIEGNSVFSFFKRLCPVGPAFYFATSTASSKEIERTLETPLEPMVTP